MIAEIVTQIETALPKGFVLQNFHFNLQKNGFWLGARIGPLGLDGADSGVEQAYTNATLSADLALAVTKILADLGTSAVTADADLVAKKALLDKYAADKAT